MIQPSVCCEMNVQVQTSL